jgi:hypothetical protein
MQEEQVKVYYFKTMGLVNDERLSGPATRDEINRRGFEVIEETVQEVPVSCLEGGFLRRASQC